MNREDEAQKVSLALDMLPIRTQLEVVVASATRSVSGASKKELEDKRAHAHRLARELVGLEEASAYEQIQRSRGRVYSLYLVMELTKMSGRAAPANANEGLRIANLASAILKRIPESIRRQDGPRLWLDLQGGVSAERGNALRILGRRREARLAFREAFVLANSGTHDLLLAARIAFLAGSHYWSRRRIRAASTALSFAEGVYGSLGEELRLGETQLKQAALLDYQGQLLAALSLQQEALGRLDEGADPVAALAAHANLAEMMQKGGKPQDALSVLSASVHLAEELTRGPALGKWYWIRGRCRIASGISAGEADLRAAWGLLEPLGDTLSLGLVGKDLCCFYLEQCDLEQLEHWVGPMVRALEQHVQSSLVVRELAKLQESVKRLAVDATHVRQVLDLVSKTMSQRTRR